MANQVEIRDILADLRDVATGGYALAFHVRFSTPTFLFQTYPKKWLDYYSQNGLVLSDPTVAWGFQNLGAVQWAALKNDDPKGVLAKASEFGLNFGMTCAVEVDGSRSIGSFARPDRDFDDAEQAFLVQKIDELHDLTANIKALAPETNKALRLMSVQFTHT